MSFAVVLDTCVLYPAHLRDTLLRQAERGFFRVLWSADIIDELRRNLVEGGFDPRSIDQLTAEMQRAFPETRRTVWMCRFPCLTSGSHPPNLRIRSSGSRIFGPQRSGSLLGGWPDHGSTMASNRANQYVHVTTGEYLPTAEPASRCGVSRWRNPMITGELKSKIDRIWNDFWSGGISNPLEVMEQITYLLFVKRLDDLHTLEENKASPARRAGRARTIFPKGSDGLAHDGHPEGRPYVDLRWSTVQAPRSRRDVRGGGRARLPVPAHPRRLRARPTPPT